MNIYGIIGKNKDTCLWYIYDINVSFVSVY